jgi:hypothetical protein
VLILNNLDCTKIMQNAVPLAAGGKFRRAGRVLKWPVVALAASVGLFILWTATQRSGDAGSAPNEDSSPFRVPHEDASVIPGIGHFSLATPVEFDPDAV